MRAIVLALMLARGAMGAVYGDPHREALLEGEAAYQAKEYTKAIRCFTAVIRKYPDDKDAWSDRGGCYLVRKLFAKAIADYTASIRLDPAQWEVHFHRAQAHEGLKDYGKAIDDYYFSIENNPTTQEGSVEVYNELAWLLATCPVAKFRDWKAAVTNAQAAWEASVERSANVKDTLAAAYAEAGDFASAVKWEKDFLATPGLVKKEALGARERLGFYEKGRAWRVGE